MPKNSLTQDLRYLRLMDALLDEPGLYAGLNVSDFARERKVDPHTVRRWLKALKDLGQRIVEYPEDGAKVGASSTTTPRGSSRGSSRCSRRTTGPPGPTGSNPCNG